MIIGLTGGIASGKTSVSNILREMGAIIIDSDKIAREILEKNKTGWKRVIDHFGPGILTEEQEIDRSRLGKIVFNDSQARKKLEKMTHPLIIEEIKRRIKSVEEEGKVIVLDIPLLYEKGLDRLVDQVWVVYVDRKTQLERLMRRDDFSPEEAKKRIAAQLDLEKKRQLADVVIDNRGSIENLRIEIIKLWNNLKKKSKNERK